jgi:CheY-like chemotaxis protein/two-component sensor histidine kinase
VSRITRGRLELKVATVDLESLVEAAVETAKPLIDSKQHQLQVELPPQRVMLAVDPLRVSQALSNLLTNAAKYTDARGRIELAVAVSAQGVRLAVKDTGIGFESGALPGMFEMFSQVDSAIARSEGGLGIGLALVKGLVALHDGHVEGFSAGPGKGSEFAIYLPQSVIVPGSGEAPATAACCRQGTDVAIKILVADDNRDAADSLALLLEMNGHEVAVAHSGEEALRIARQQLPHAMILDIGMPDVTGYEVARRVRAESWGGEVLLIAATGWGQKEDKDRASAAGFDRHMTKPADPDAIEGLLQEFVNSRGTLA